MSSPIQIQLLEQRIVESGLTVRQFALEVVLREPRTVGRWLDGTSPIPDVVVRWLEGRAA